MAMHIVRKCEECCQSEQANIYITWLRQSLAVVLAALLIVYVYWQGTRLNAARDLLAERQFRETRLVDAAPVGLILCDSEGVVRVFNTAAEAICGYKKDEIIGKSAELLVDPAVRDIHTAKLTEAREVADERQKKWRSTRERLQANVLHKDGHLVPVILTISIVRHTSGLVEFICVIQRAEDNG